MGSPGLPPARHGHVLYLVVRGRLAVLQPDAKGSGGRFLVLLHEVDAPRGFLGAALIWGKHNHGIICQESGWTNGKGVPAVLGRGERAGTPPCQEHRFAVPGSPCRRGAPTFHYGRILPRGPGCAGSRLLQELGSDPQPTGALGRGVGLGTRRAVGRAGSGGHSRDRAPWMGPHQPPPQDPRCLPACPGSCPGPMGAHGALPALWCSPHRAAPHAGGPQG